MDQIREAVEHLKSVIPDGLIPEIGIIGGSGLAALESAIKGERCKVSYEQIKGFPVSTGKSREAFGL